MNIIILDYSSGKIFFGNCFEEDLEMWIVEKGFNLEDIEWMVVDDFNFESIN